MFNNNEEIEEIDVETPFFLMSEKLYLRMKFFVTLILPAISTLYFTLDKIWGLYEADKVIGTFAALATFLGVLLRLSTNAYKKSDLKYDGNIIIKETASGGKLYSLELNGQPSVLDGKKEVSFKVAAR